MKNVSITALQFVNEPRSRRRGGCGDGGGTATAGDLQRFGTWRIVPWREHRTTLCVVL